MDEDASYVDTFEEDHGPGGYAYQSALKDLVNIAANAPLYPGQPARGRLQVEGHLGSV